MADSITEETPNGATHCTRLVEETINPTVGERQVPSRDGQDALRMGTTAIQPLHKEPQDFAKLCAPCYGLFSTPDAQRALASKAGYLHSSGVEELERVATSDCPFCKQLANEITVVHNGVFQNLPWPTLRFWATVGQDRCWQMVNGPADWEQRQISATKHLTGNEQACIPLSREYQFDGIYCALVDEIEFSSASFALFAQHGKIPRSSPP